VLSFCGVLALLATFIRERPSMAEIPDAIHRKAIDAACDGDRAWFENHPQRNFRLRDMVPYENNGPIEEPPPGMSWRAIVIQIEKGARFRTFLAVSSDLQNDGAGDGQLRRLFEQSSPREMLQVVRKARKHWKKSKAPRS
jgi:hypothetical protein